MGRLVIVVLVIVTVIVLWQAFGPKTWNTASRTPQNNQFPTLGRQRNRTVTTKGPDDDPDFLWNIKKERFKAQREAERREQEAVERARRGEHWKADGAKDDGNRGKTPDDGNRGKTPDDAAEKNAEKKPDTGKSDGTGTQEKKDGEGSAQG
jgi:hypothetical protein